jgi:hypothetical protein
LHRIRAETRGTESGLRASLRLAPVRKPEAYATLTPVPSPILYNQSVHRAVLLSVLLQLHAQDGPARSKAADYPAHAALQGMEIGAEYLDHSVPSEKGSYIAKEYLVVEVGVFASTPDSISVKSGQFSLRINDGKKVLVPVSPGTVAGALKYPDWENQHGASVQAGPVIYGSPAGVGRFPGDPGAPPPIQPPVEAPPDPSGIEKQIPTSIDESIAKVAFPDGPVHKEARGCLFFRYSGRMKSIRSLDLIYDSGEDRPKATIKLF